jgi:hypothetical protein
MDINEQCLREFPEANNLAFKRLHHKGTIFFDTKTHRLLDGYRNQEQLVVYTLRLVVIYTRQMGIKFSLSRDEQRLLSSYDTPP